jgi:hypothetical protein
MRLEFSENSRRLLRNSLTVEMRDFPLKFADAGGLERAAAARFNRSFTMTGRNGALSRRIRGPRLALV